MKIASRDILDVLRRFDMADETNIPRHVEMIKITHPNPINTLVSFHFMKKQLFVLFDDTANDDTYHVISQIRALRGDIKGLLVENPRDTTLTYAMPFRGKDCYLFQAISDKKRLDSELSTRYPENSRSTWQKHILAGHISVNGTVATSTKQFVTEADSISINTPELPDFSQTKLPIIYIDDNIIVINKPCGVLSHSKGALNDEFTVAEFFRQYTSYGLGTNRPGIIHRLDRDTSGIMIGARNEDTATMLQKQFVDRKTKKTYFAVLNGIPKLNKANIDLPIGRNPSVPSTFRVDSKGKSATTRYEVLAVDGKLSLVKLQPTTGRTHQLRVHLAYINTPILGDKVYGKPADRLFLHAYSLEITIPGGERKIFTAPLPDEFTAQFPEVKI